MTKKKKSTPEAVNEMNTLFALPPEESPPTNESSPSSPETTPAQTKPLPARSSASRITPVYPGEYKRRKRSMTVTFPDETAPQLLRALAKQWGLTTNNGQRPSPSAALDWLIRPRLEAAKRGEIEPPPAGWDLGDPFPED